MSAINAFGEYLNLFAVSFKILKTAHAETERFKIFFNYFYIQTEIRND